MAQLGRHRTPQVDAGHHRVGSRRRHRQTDAPDLLARGELGQLGPGPPAVAAAVQRAARAALGELPGRALALPECRVQGVGVGRVHHQVAGAAPLTFAFEHLLPAAAAVLGQVDTAAAAGRIELAGRGHEDTPAVARIDPHAGDAVGIGQALVLEGLATVAAQVDAVAAVVGARRIGLAGAHPQGVGGARVHRHIAHHGVEELVGQRLEAAAVVHGLPHAAAGVGHVEARRLARHHLHIDHPTTLHRGADGAPPQRARQRLLLHALVLLPGGGANGGRSRPFGLRAGGLGVAQAHAEGQANKQGQMHEKALRARRGTPSSGGAARRPLMVVANQALSAAFATPPITAPAMAAASKSTAEAFLPRSRREPSRCRAR